MHLWARYFVYVGRSEGVDRGWTRHLCGCVVRDLTMQVDNKIGDSEAGFEPLRCDGN